MCGFAGVVAWDERYRATRDTLAAMSARVAHRGPDGEGIFLAGGDGTRPGAPHCGFIFRRLSILDPDPRAMQPFTIGDKTIVCNGEVYNFRELRAELTMLRPEYAWRTSGDTEVLLLAFDTWREKCLDRLNGMFAFAVWDGQDESLFFARDRMGQKPLYLAELDRGDLDARPGSVAIQAVAFASELSALQPVGWFDKRIDTQGLTDFLSWGYIGGGRTIYHSAKKIPPGHWCRFTAGGVDGARYFCPNRPSADGMAEDPARTTRDLVVRAVRRQLVSDVPLGCFLSGGMDSSVIAAAMTAPGGAPDRVKTFSIGFEDSRYDESGYAQAVARHLGTDHTTFRVCPDAAADLSRLAAVFGEPFGDSSAVPTHYLSRETRARVTVALSGDGGDELFGGYYRYRAARIGEAIARLPKALRQSIAATAAAMPGDASSTLSSRMKRFMVSLGDDPARRYSGFMRIFRDESLAQLLDRSHPRRAGVPDVIEQHYLAELEAGRDATTAALAVDRLTYLPDDLLVKVDRASMVHGLEVRSPFMDHELVEFAAGLTTSQLLKGGPKRLLREAFSNDLPSWVFTRPKMGFAVPIGDWFRGRLRPMLHDNLFAGNAFARQYFDMKAVHRFVREHENGQADHSQRLFAMLMLELWWRTSR